MEGDKNWSRNKFILIIFLSISTGNVSWTMTNENIGFKVIELEHGDLSNNAIGQFLVSSDQSDIKARISRLVLKLGSDCNLWRIPVKCYKVLKLFSFIHFEAFFVHFLSVFTELRKKEFTWSSRLHIVTKIFFYKTPLMFCQCFCLYFEVTRM